MLIPILIAVVTILVYRKFIKKTMVQKSVTLTPRLQEIIHLFSYLEVSKSKTGISIKGYTLTIAIEDQKEELSINIQGKAPLSNENISYETKLPTSTNNLNLQIALANVLNKYMKAYQEASGKSDLSYLELERELRDNYLAIKSANDLLSTLLFLSKHEDTKGATLKEKQLEELIEQLLANYRELLLQISKQKLKLEQLLPTNTSTNSPDEKRWVPMVDLLDEIFAENENVKNKYPQYATRLGEIDQTTFATTYQTEVLKR